MNIRIFALAALIWVSLSASLTVNGAPQTPEERDQWKTEIRQYNRNYHTKQHEHTREQQTKFYPLYD